MDLILAPCRSRGGALNMARALTVRGEAGRAYALDRPCARAGKPNANRHQRMRWDASYAPSPGPEPEVAGWIGSCVLVVTRQCAQLMGLSGRVRPAVWWLRRELSIKTATVVALGRKFGLLKHPVAWGRMEIRHCRNCWTSV